MKVTPYLTFAGNCEEAMNFYAQVTGGEITLVMRMGEMMGDDTPPGLGDKMAHMTLELEAGHLLFASDTFDESAYQGVEGAAMHVSAKTPEDAIALFSRFSEGGSVTMPIGKTDWAEMFGMCRDKFGVGWMVDCEATAS